MSSYLAPATVTAVLERLLQSAFDRDLPGATAVAGRPRSNGDEAAGVVIFLLDAEANAAGANADLPTRGADGVPRHRPAVALDLHYLLICYGDAKALEPDRVLGVVSRTLHAHPVVTRAQIEAVVAAAVDPDGPMHDYLATTDLAEQINLVRLTPEPLSLEARSNLWTGAQAPWNLSLAYRAAPIVIEEEVPVTVGAPVRLPAVQALPFRLPRIDQAAGVDGPLGPAGRLLLTGEHLQGELTAVRIGAEELDAPAASDQRITVSLSALKAPPLGGRNPVAVVHLVPLGDPPSPHVGAVSPPATVVVHPPVTAVRLNAGTLRIETGLVLRAGALVAVTLSDPATGQLRHRLGGRTPDPAASVVEVPTGPVGPGTYDVGLSIDGEAGPPTGWQVTVP